MNFILKISPAFLKRFDHYLRVNHPWIWATRIHLNLYFSVLLSLFFIALGLFYQMDPKNVITESEQNFFFGILFIPAVILLGFLIYNMSIYNPDKKEAYRFKYQEFFVLLIYYSTLSLPLLIPYPASWVLNARIANIQDSEILEQQAVSFELGSYYFPSNRANYQYFPNDSIFLISLNSQMTGWKPGKEYIERIHLQNTIWKKLRDSIFDHKGVFKNQRPPLYYTSFIDEYDGYSFRNGVYGEYPQANLNNFSLLENDIFKSKKRQLLLHPNEGLAKDYINKFSELLFIYSDVDEVTTSKIYEDYSLNIYFPSYAYQDLRFEIQKTASNLHQIKSAKIKTSLSWSLKTYTSLAFAVFLISLLFQIFKNSHWSQLLRSALFIGLFYTVVLVIDAASNFSNGFLLIIPFYSFIVIAILSLRGFILQKFSTLFVQFNIYLTLLSPFFFLLLLGYMHNVHQFFYWSWFDGYKEMDNEGILDYGFAHSQMISHYYDWALWIGVLSYVFIWNSYLKSLYLRYWSLPKNT